MYSYIIDTTVKAKEVVTPWPGGTRSKDPLHSTTETRSMKNNYIHNETPSPAPPVLALTLRNHLPLDLDACNMEEDRLFFALNFETPYLDLSDFEDDPFWDGPFNPPAAPALSLAA
jgi:hypothetical protein